MVERSSRIDCRLAEILLEVAVVTVMAFSWSTSSAMPARASQSLAVAVSSLDSPQAGS
jgi:hypothetical protein